MVAVRSPLGQSDRRVGIPSDEGSALANPLSQPTVKHTDDALYDSIANFGELYDAVPLYTNRSDIAFYVDEAVRSGGSVLEAGCGTGRVLIPTARAGVDITGIDSSAMMLERCRERLAGES